MTIICLKYRLYPTKSQVSLIQDMLETCREVYNSLLHWRKYAYEMGEKTPTCYEQQAALAVWKDETFADGSLCHPDLKVVNAQVLQQVAERVNLAFNAFFRRVKQGEKPGYPRFKGVGRYDSLTYKQDTAFSTGEDFIQFSKIGRIKAVLHRHVFGRPKQVVLQRQGLNWYACVFTDVEGASLHESSEAVAMDMGLEKFAVLSNGDMIANPRFLRKQEKKLKKAQRKLDRDKRDRKKVASHRKTISRIHEKTRNQRHDFLHQAAHKLVDRFGIFFLEDLNVKNMSKRPAPKQDAETGQYLPNGASQKSGLNKSILDAAWNMFRCILTEKAERAGRKVIEVNPAHTSQDCYVCGYRAKKKLSERWHLCPMCGASLDRDLNAAMNILALGMQRLGANP